MQAPSETEKKTRLDKYQIKFERYQKIVHDLHLQGEIGISPRAILIALLKTYVNAPLKTTINGNNNQGLSWITNATAQARQIAKSSLKSFFDSKTSKRTYRDYTVQLLNKLEELTEEDLLDFIAAIELELSEAHTIQAHNPQGDFHVLWTVFFMHYPLLFKTRQINSGLEVAENQPKTRAIECTESVLKHCWMTAQHWQKKSFTQNIDQIIDTLFCGDDRRLKITNLDDIQEYLTFIRPYLSERNQEKIIRSTIARNSAAEAHLMPIIFELLAPVLSIENNAIALRAILKIIPHFLPGPEKNSNNSRATNNLKKAVLQSAVKSLHPLIKHGPLDTETIVLDQLYTWCNEGDLEQQIIAIQAVTSLITVLSVPARIEAINKFTPLLDHPNKLICIAAIQGLACLIQPLPKRYNLALLAGVTNLEEGTLYIESDSVNPQPQHLKYRVLDHRGNPTAEQEITLEEMPLLEGKLLESTDPDRIKLLEQLEPLLPNILALTENRGCTHPLHLKHIPLRKFYTFLEDDSKKVRVAALHAVAACASHYPNQFFENELKDLLFDKLMTLSESQWADSRCDAIEMFSKLIPQLKQHRNEILSRRLLALRDDPDNSVQDAATFCMGVHFQYAHLLDQKIYYSLLTSMLNPATNCVSAVSAFSLIAKHLSAAEQVNTLNNLSTVMHITSIDCMKVYSKLISHEARAQFIAGLLSLAATRNADQRVTLDKTIAALLPTLPHNLPALGQCINNLWKLTIENNNPYYASGELLRLLVNACDI
jgi:hypothetical protein